ncbi:hypothetical protein F5Y17DRAFT_462911 [Xylariaceae sp. FL0594]|nr:hypothetical protein F5Y17DRAFT_462911 [Xylariaceae sp. FL0594]
MGDEAHIKVVAKYAARLGQCFSTARPLTNGPISQSVQEKHLVLYGWCRRDLATPGRVLRLNQKRVTSPVTVGRGACESRRRIAQPLGGPSHSDSTSHCRPGQPLANQPLLPRQEKYSAAHHTHQSLAGCSGKRGSSAPAPPYTRDGQQQGLSAAAQPVSGTRNRSYSRNYRVHRKHFLHSLLYSSLFSKNQPLNSLLYWIPLLGNSPLRHQHSNKDTMCRILRFKRPSFRPQHFIRLSEQDEKKFPLGELRNMTLERPFVLVEDVRKEQEIKITVRHYNNEQQDTLFVQFESDLGRRGLAAWVLASCLGTIHRRAFVLKLLSTSSAQDMVDAFISTIASETGVHPGSITEATLPYGMAAGQPSHAQDIYGACARVLNFTAGPNKKCWCKPLRRSPPPEIQVRVVLDLGLDGEEGTQPRPNASPYKTHGEPGKEHRQCLNNCRRSLGRAGKSRRQANIDRWACVRSSSRETSSETMGRGISHNDLWMLSSVLSPAERGLSLPSGDSKHDLEGTLQSAAQKGAHVSPAHPKQRVHLRVGALCRTNETKAVYEALAAGRSFAPQDRIIKLAVGSKEVLVHARVLVHSEFLFGSFNNGSIDDVCDQATPPTPPPLRGVGVQEFKLVMLAILTEKRAKFDELETSDEFQKLRYIVARPRDGLRIVAQRLMDEETGWTIRGGGHRLEHRWRSAGSRVTWRG